MLGKCKCRSADAYLASSEILDPRESRPLDLLHSQRMRDAQRPASGVWKRRQSEIFTVWWTRGRTCSQTVRLLMFRVIFTPMMLGPCAKCRLSVEVQLDVLEFVKSLSGRWPCCPVKQIGIVGEKNCLKLITSNGCVFWQSPLQVPPNHFFVWGWLF